MTKSCFTAFFVVLFLGVQLALGSTSEATTTSENRGLASRIVGGSDAKLKRFPYFTFFKGFDEYGTYGWCAGSLIARDVILTTASCLSVGLTYDVWVNSTTIKHTKYEHFRGANKSVVHPNANSFKHDVGLLFLNKPVPARVPLVTMNRNGAIPVLSDPTSEMTVIGLGESYQHVNDTYVWTSPKALMKVQLDPTSLMSCKKVYSSGQIGAWNFCAGGAGDKGVCYGDNGGPMLMMKESARTDVQVGIASGYSTWDCPKQVDRPDVFTRVSYHAKWIDAEVCKYSKYIPSTITCPPTRQLRAATANAV